MPLQVALPRVLIPLVRPLLRSSSRRSMPISLGMYQARRTGSYQAYRASVLRSRYRGRHDWQRTRLPVYGSFGLTIPSAYVIVPDSLRFAYSNPYDLPVQLPQIRIAQTRNRGFYERYEIPFPDYEIVASTAPPRQAGTGGIPPEGNRPRHDSKVPGFYNRFNAFVTRTYGTVSEVGDFSSAVINNLPDPIAVSTALALERAIDVAYGRRAKLLKEHVYGKYWNLPFGIDFARRGYGLWS